MATDGSQIVWRKRLTVRLLFLTAVASLLIGIVIAAIQVVSDMRALRQHRDALAEQALTLLSEPASEAVYNIDDAMARRVVNGLMGIPGVRTAELRLSTGETLASQQREEKPVRLRGVSDRLLGPESRHSRALYGGRNREVLGEIELRIDNAVIGEEFVQRAVTLALIEPLRAIVLGLVVFALLYRFLTRPLLTTMRALERVDPREPEMTRLPIPRGHESDEFGGSVTAVNRLLDSIRDSLSKRREAEARATFLSQYDEITQLPNRRMLLMRLGHLLPTLAEGRQLVLMHIDLIDFRGINQHLGESGGDAAMREAGRRLLERAGSEGLVARLADDSFALALPVCDGGRPALRILAQAALDALARTYSHQGREVPLHAAIGIAVYPDDADSAETLMQCAEQAYARAERGSDPIRFHEAGLDSEQRLRRRLGREIAIVDFDEQFIVDYQPLVDAEHGQTASLEALVRWRHPELGLLPPAVFISIAEQRGSINALGDFVLLRVCSQMAAWKAGLGRGLRVAVNVSAAQLRDPDFDTRLATILETTALPAQLLELEITETAVVENFDLAHGLLQRVRALGVSIAIDDFGTGHASLSYLKRLPIDKLKIDGSFVRELLVDADDAKIVRAIINLGHSLGMRVVAEGVETVAQADRLREMRCDLLQGYLFSRPLSAADAFRYLLRQYKQTA